MEKESAPAGWIPGAARSAMTEAELQLAVVVVSWESGVYCAANFFQRFARLPVPRGERAAFSASFS